MQFNMENVAKRQTNGTHFMSFKIPEVLDPATKTNIFETDDDQRRIVLDIYIWAFLGSFVLCGIFFNILAIQTLFRAKCNGTRYLLLQLSLCDVGFLAISALELFYMNYNKWIPPAELCPVYLGMESFTSTATIYFIISINLHAISTYNLAIKTIRRQNRMSSVEMYTELTAEQTDDDNYEVAITAKKRHLTIDYSKRKAGISVILPALFIWFIAASVSIPLFVFGNVIPNELNPLICGIVNIDKHNNHLMQILVLSIRIVIPTLCIHITSIYVIVKLFLAKKNIQPCGLDENVQMILKLAFILAITFMLFSIQRLFGSLLFEIITKPFMHYKYPHMNRFIGLLFSMISFILPAIRPIIYCVMDKNIRRIFWTCCFINENSIRRQ